MSEIARQGTDTKFAADFLTVWGGQTISVFGAQITAFALSIWFFHETGSVLQFGAVITAQLLPGVLIAPFAGVLVDRYRANRVMLACEIGLLLTSALLYTLTRVDQLTPTMVLIFTPLIAIFASGHQISYAACIPLLVPKGMYGKANGYVHLGINGSAAVVPFIAVYALEMLGIAAILLINVIAYAVAALTVWVASFADSPANGPHIQMTVRTLLAQQLFGMRYFLRHRTLLVLIAFLAAINFANGIVLVLFRPLILTAASDLVLGTLVTIAGVGGLVGAVFSAVYITATDKLRALAVATLAAGIAMLCCGFIANHFALAVLVFVFSFSVPVILVTTQTLIQLNTPAEMHGRIFAARTVMGGAAMILAAIIAPVATSVLFEPWLRADGWLGSSLAQLVGAGEYGAMRAVFLCGGVIMIVLVSAASLSKSFAILRRSADLPAAPGLQPGNVPS